LHQCEQKKNANISIKLYLSLIKLNNEITMINYLTHKLWFVITLLAFFLSDVTFSQLIPVSKEEASCTSIMVGRLATTDGSVITCHSCDGDYRTWLNIIPRQQYSPGETRKILWGTMHTETPWDLRNIFEKGEIPQVDETYAYLNVSYPCLNEKQLAMGETTIVGRRELVNRNGFF
jgi:dipeptidase